MKFVHIFSLSVITIFAIGACTPTISQRGNMLEDHQITQVVPSIHTKTDVLRILGSPTTQGTFDDNTWYYIGQETEKKGILDPKVKEERIVVVAFDEGGIVNTVKDMDTARLDVPVARDKTKTHGKEMTAVQQMIGNLGKFNPNSGQR